jgi:hypothetical protein
MTRRSFVAVAASPLLPHDPEAWEDSCPILPISANPPYAYVAKPVGESCWELEIPDLHHSGITIADSTEELHRNVAFAIQIILHRDYRAKGLPYPPVTCFTQMIEVDI